MSAYDHIKIAEYWSKKWDEDGIYRTDTASDKKKRYLLVEFPYPSGEGLHVGHVRSYTAMDIVARASRRQGYEVLFPIGYDSFGLPAENYAIKTGIHPAVTTRKNVDNFRQQMKGCGFSFDWEREIETTDPLYYKWTQWIFLKLYEKGLAYKKEMPVNWCPKDKCVLANEEVLDGVCERCGTPVEKKNKHQWMLAITKYAERLAKDLDETTYLEKIKIQQRNWIGLSEGSEIDFTLKAGGTTYPFAIFTTRADTIFGCTYCVFAPEHPLVKQLLTEGKLTNHEDVTSYIKQATAKLDMDRSAEGKEKTGVPLVGISAINPATKEEIPVYIADYVLPQYGTGAIMAVPAHDDRDGAFAKTYNLPVREVIIPETGKPQVNPEPRKSIVAIVWDESTDTFLSLDWGKDFGGNLFIGGGREGDEDVVACAVREIIEETGYTDITFVSKTTTIIHNYFAHSKGVARRIEATGLLFKKTGDTTIPQKLEASEEAKFSLAWLSRQDVEKQVRDELHALVYKLLVQHQIYAGEGILMNSGVFDGQKSVEAKKKITEALGGRVVTKSKLRDWVFARQRYWGEPTPIVYDEKGAMYPVHESNLPVVLPQVDKFEPTDNGESPLYQVPEWVHVRGYIDEAGYFHEDITKETVFKRETDTMPQWAGSSWYFMRYIDPKNDTAIGDPELLKTWLPVDWYNGGMEHTTLHLLYSRFWYKFLFDIGIVPTSEPYHKRTSQGMILGAGGVKMSKSLGNVVNPDQIVRSSGADVLRVYEMFIGPFDQSVAWDDKAIVGVERFLDKVYKLSERVGDAPSLPTLHQTVKKVTEGIESMAFNTCISQLMICANEFEKVNTIRVSDFEAFLMVLAPFAPFITEELWKDLGHTSSIHTAPWPVADESLLVEKEVTIAVQIGGKLRGTVTLPRDSDEATVMAAVLATESCAKYLHEQTVKKTIFVPNKLVNIVI